MKRRLDQRLDRLSTRRGAGCPTCSRWTPCVYEDGEGVPDRPSHCPDCGRDVPIELVRRIIGITWSDI